MIDFPPLLNRLVERKDLSAKETRSFLDAVVAGELSPAQIAAALVALRSKGEVASEIEGLVRAMRSHMLHVDAPDAIDIVGTGGDGSGTFNISTAAALVAVGAGAKVAKHGNRAASSACGSADVLEALGVNINLTPRQASEVYTSVGMVFLMAPLYHAAMKHVVLVRRELKVRTIFNVLGPFANPANTQRQLVGVPDIAIAKTMAKVAASLGYERIMIVASEDGMDEISLGAKTRGFEVRGTLIKAHTIDPRKFGLKKASKKLIRGGTAEENAGIITGILGGKKGAPRDVVVLNAAYALYVAGVVTNPKMGIQKAQESIDSGAARAALQRLVVASNAYTSEV